LRDGNKDDATRHSTTGITIRQLRKVYKSLGKPTVVAVDCVDLEAPQGRITALLGHNGAGKTTTMHIITGTYTYQYETSFSSGLFKINLGYNGTKHFIQGLTIFGHIYKI